MTFELPDGAQIELPDGATGADVAAAIGPGLARAALAVEVDGVMYDLARPLPDGAAHEIVTVAQRPGRAGPHPPRRRARAGHARSWSSTPGQDLDRPADRARLLLRLRVPRRRARSTDADFERIEERMREHIRADEPLRARGRAGRRRRWSASAPRARTTRSS